jgi:hypothetical protein
MHADQDAGVLLGLPPAANGLPLGVDQFAPDVLPRTRVLFNAGDGWSTLAESIGASFKAGLRGLDGSVLFPFAEPAELFLEPGQPDPADIQCLLGEITPDSFACLQVDAVQDVFVVDDTLAYALMGGTRLLRHDGTRWRAHPSWLPYPAEALWADREHVIAVGSGGTVLSLEGEAWVLQDPGRFVHFTAVWGRSADDLWLGTSAGALVHYDGTSWLDRAQLGGVTCGLRFPIEGIRGVGNDVFAYTSRELVRFGAGEPQSLGNWSCSASPGAPQIGGVWGQREDEVFVTVHETVGQSQCGNAFIAHYDGERFHRF